MGYEARNGVSAAETLREIVVTGRDGVVQRYEGRRVQVGVPERVVLFVGDDGSEHVVTLLPGDHVWTKALESGKVIALERKIEVVGE